MLGYGGEGRRGVSYLLSGHELETHSYIFYYLSRKGFSKTICVGCEHMGCEPNKEEAEGKQ